MPMRKKNKTVNNKKLLELSKKINLEQLPIGAYIDDIYGNIIAYNHIVKEMLGLPDNAKGLNIKDYYKNPVEREELQKEVEKTESNGSRFEKRIIQFKQDGGRNIFIQDYTCSLRDKQGVLSGYLNCLDDVTQEAESAQRIKDITSDAGVLFHSTSAAFITIHNNVKAVLPYLSPDVFEPNKCLSPSSAEEAIQKAKTQLAESIDKLIIYRNDEFKRNGLNEAKWEHLQHLQQQLTGSTVNTYTVERRITLFQHAAKQIIEIAETASNGCFEKGLMFNIIDNAKEVLRISNLIVLHQTQDVLVDMEKQVRNLREYIIDGLKREEKRQNKICELINIAIRNMGTYSDNQEVDIRPIYKNPELNVSVYESQIKRAFTNLLHNAIKYSWRYSRINANKKPFVTIRQYIKDSNVCIEFENRGVPIPEVDKSRLFHIGYRGKYASDRGRSGTGIGLYDAQNVARRHGGSVSIDSRPVKYTGSKIDNKNEPYITTVTFIMPIKENER